MTGNYRIYTAAYLLRKDRVYSYLTIIRSALFCCTLLSAPLALSADISRMWKHAKEPVWIEISLEKGVGVVVRNDKLPDRIGREILKDITASKSEQALWHGLIYIEKLAEYKSVAISLPEADLMMLTGKVGFMSRTVAWVRDNPALPNR